MTEVDLHLLSGIGFKLEKTFLLRYLEFPYVMANR
jgi:hypothetical protein